MDEEQQMYLEQLMDNYKFPQNVGKLKDFTFFRHQKNPSCGDTFDLFVKVEKEIITNVKYSGDGCAISTASFSLLSQKLINMKFSDAKKLTDKDIYEMIGVNISPGRVNCAMLSLNAFLEGSKEK
jgi:nitrogen fixation NifU-like protein